MNRAILTLVVLLFAAGLNRGQPTAHVRSTERIISPSIVLRTGLVLSASARVKPGSYRLPAPVSPDSAVITIRGDNITIDFSGAVMEGTNPDADPDSGSGVAIRVEGGRNIRILHAHTHGYKIGVLARGTHGLVLLDNDFSYNWKPRLFSLIEHESLIDWLSFHHNEKGEWLRYGAGLYLDSVSGGEIRNNRGVQGMNGLMINRSDHLRISDNIFSFNSGLGIGLYRSNDNTIIHNCLDYNVRGYSHRFYHRGQDSADLLVYEQSSRNVIAYNSATHGGDGFFLWAGQTTMDSGNGGANDNLLYGNDFSYSPANGIEATFSRNTFVGNRMEGCDYGIWGGYSFESKIVGNRFTRNRVGIAIEHGQDNVISSNRFDGDTTAVSLWTSTIEPSDWGYPKHHDTRSRDYRLENNFFADNRYGVKATGTAGLVLANNRWSHVDTATIFRDTSNVRSEGNGTIDRSAGNRTLDQSGDNRTTVRSRGNRSVLPPDRSSTPIPPGYAKLAPRVRRGENRIPLSPAAQMNRSAIIVDEWGPYDYQSPKLWPLDGSNEIPLRLRTLGPPGSWRVVSWRGIENLSHASGNIGDTIAVTPLEDSVGNWELALEYQGKATVSPRGERRAAGKPYQFSFNRFEPAIDWNIRFFSWTDSADPRSRNDAFSALLRTAPILTQRTSRLDYEWYRPLIKELPQERFALEANGSVTLAPGTYTLQTISDDGVRVWVDGVLVIDNWTQHGSTLDYASLGAGNHELRVQYFQVDGWTEFRLDIVRGVRRSAGSPG